MLTPMLGWVPVSLSEYPRCTEPIKASLGQGKMKMVSPLAGWVLTKPMGTNFVSED